MRESAGMSEQEEQKEQREHGDPARVRVTFSMDETDSLRLKEVSGNLGMTMAGLIRGLVAYGLDRIFTDEELAHRLQSCARADRIRRDRAASLGGRRSGDSRAGRTGSVPSSAEGDL